MTSFGRINWNFVTALGLMFVVVAACNRSRKSSLPSSSRETKASEAVPSGELTAEALFQEYQKDKNAAD